MTGQVQVVDRRRHHRCSICLALAQWSDAWSWYGSERDVDDGRLILKACSDPCRAEVRRQGGAVRVLAQMRRETS